MIEFFLSPQRIKLLLAGGGVLLLAVAGLLVGSVHVSGKLDTERAEHQTTRLERDNAVAEGMRWKAVADAAEPKITALQGAVGECLARESQAQVDAAERDRIMAAMIPVKRPPEGNNNDVIIVDDATRKQAVERLNRPL